MVILVKIKKIVRVKGVEPPRLAALDPKSSTSTNSATPAYRQRYYFLTLMHKINFKDFIKNKKK